MPVLTRPVLTRPRMVRPRMVRAGAGDVSLLDQVIAAMYGSGEQGAFYAPWLMDTLFQDAAGTTPVTAADQPVGLMLDLSGNGNHASQATADKRLLLKLVDGRWCLRTDGVNDVLVTGVSGIQLPHGSGITVVAAAEWLTLPDNCKMGVNTDNMNSLPADKWEIGCHLSTRSPRIVASGRTPLVIDRNFPAVIDKELYTYQWDYASATSSRLRAWRNGGAAGSTDTGSVATTAWPDGFEQGNPFVIGARHATGASDYVEADWYGVLIRAAASTDDERQFVHSLFAERAGVAL